MILRLHDKNPTVASVQEMLNYIGFRYKEANKATPLKVDGHFGAKTLAVVLDFQSSQGILRDGIVGPVTFKALENEYTEQVLEFTSPGPDAVDGRRKSGFRTEPVPADPYNQTHARFFLREDAAAAYRQIRKTVLSQGGILSISAGIRHLFAKTTANRSTVSLHYLGRALDLFIYGGMMNPSEDPYVVLKGENNYWEVYARCSTDWPFNPDDAPAKNDIQLPPPITLKNPVTYKDPTASKNKPVKGHFINLTAIFKEHGFSPIHFRPAFVHGSMMSAEWWHFQYEKGLIPEITTFGDELQKLYTDETLIASPVWQFRHRIFSGHSFV